MAEIRQLNANSHLPLALSSSSLPSTRVTYESPSLESTAAFCCGGHINRKPTQSLAPCYTIPRLCYLFGVPNSTAQGQTLQFRGAEFLAEREREDAVEKRLDIAVYAEYLKSTCPYSTYKEKGQERPKDSNLNDFITFSRPEELILQS